MKASVLLRRVRTAMADPKVNTSPFICDNLRSYGRDRAGMTYDTVDRLCEHIDELLGGAFSLREWLVDNGHVEGARLDPMKTCYDGPIDYDKLQRTRIAWLDHLISHYETQGD